MDDDIAAGLPKPPPPAPARRDAAINAALRRFDGEAEPVAARKQGGWTWQGSQQAVGWASAALVALVGIPTAWTYMGQSGPTEDHTATASDNATDFSAANASVARDRPPSMVAIMTDEAPQTVERRKAAEAMASPQAVAPKAEPGRERGVVSEANRLPPLFVAPSISTVAAPPAPVVSMPAGRSADSEAVANRYSLAPAPAPAPAAEAQRTRANEDDIVVTSMRRSEPRSRKTDDAIAAFDRAVEQSPRSSDAYLSRGLAYQRAGRPDRALADLNRAVRYDPASARAYRSRGAFFRQTGDLKRALADEQRADKLDAGN